MPIYNVKKCVSIFYFWLAGNINAYFKGCEQVFMLLSVMLMGFYAIAANKRSKKAFVDVKTLLIACIQSHEHNRAGA